jgi:hypothetical protein
MNYCNDTLSLGKYKHMYPYEQDQIQQLFHKDMVLMLLISV